MEQPDNNKIEELQKDLYARNYKEVVPPRSSFEKPAMDVETFWNSANKTDRPVTPPKVGSVFKKIFIFAIIFFLLSSSLAVYVFFKGFNIISADKVNITFVGPVSVAAGDVLSFDVVVQNENDAPLVKPVIYIDYPEGTKEATDLTKDLLHGKEELGDIVNAQKDARRTARAVLFGEQLSSKQIKVTLEYGVKNSTAVFKKEKTYDIQISSAPLSMIVSHPSEIVSNNEVELMVDVVSNSTTPLRNLLLKVEYPFGFEIGSSTPAVTYNNNLWKIGTLGVNERKSFVIRGRIEGEEGDERIFRVSVGAQSATNDKLIATAYLTSLESIHLKKPPIAVQMALNNITSNNVVTSLGSGVMGSINFMNNLADPLVNAEVEVFFTGSIVNYATPRPQQGFYRSLDNKLLWNKTTIPTLGVLEPGDSRIIGFAFSILPASQLPPIKNGSLTVTAIVSGKRVSNTQEDQTVTTRITRTMKIGTTAALNSRVTRAAPPFTNTGPVPPKVNIKSTYTVVWSLSNTSNIVTGAEVRATIPTQYVTWKNAVSPSSERITWNPERSEVVWQVGELGVNTSGKPVREVAFQVEILPSISQVGSAPVLVDYQSFKGVDSFTGENLASDFPALSTNTSADPRVQDGIVTQ